MNNEINKKLLKQLEQKLKFEYCFELDSGSDLLNIVLRNLNKDPKKCIRLIKCE